MTKKQKLTIEKKARDIKSTLGLKRAKEWKRCAKWSAEYYGEFGGLPF